MQCCFSIFYMLILKKITLIYFHPAYLVRLDKYGQCIKKGIVKTEGQNRSMKGRKGLLVYGREKRGRNTIRIGS